ncbi:hypothetical protein [Actinacidiphila oryziradicis]|uniref:hypothetical protein n=1 Tax=Actinacidiphila oryziradicis TaxID=2571141 RepID=UPI0023F44B01|nr:hypothetical protein [Actinacidiphila oryziradicis]
MKVCHSVRKTLVDEPGLEPCPALHDLHRAILLADDQVLEACPAACSVSPGPANA